jgi:hypothetical protein
MTREQGADDRNSKSSEKEPTERSIEANTFLQAMSSLSKSSISIQKMTMLGIFKRRLLYFNS